MLTADTKLQQVAPGERDLSKAVTITVRDIRLGDRVVARGALAGDKVIDARSVIVMSQTAIAKRHEHDQQDWQQRGAAGRVTGVDSARKEITIEVPSLTQNQTVVVALKDGTTVRRYAENSVRYADAKPSTVAEIRVGDQLRARGDKVEDGSRITADEIVTGAFRSLAARVVSVAGDTVQAEELGSNRPLTITLTKDTVLKRFPQGGFGESLRFGPGRAGGSLDAGSSGVRQPAGGPGADGAPGGAAAGPRGGGPGAIRRMPDLQAMIERLPATTTAELKPGESLIVSTMGSGDAPTITAVRVLAGADAILEMRQRMAARSAAATGAQTTTPGTPGGTWNIGDFSSLPIQ
jgi:hypothetical protein